MVNSVAISNDGSRLVAGTYFYPYKGTHRNHTDGTFGTYCFDSAGGQLWKNEFNGNEGVYDVAISGNGAVAVAGGLVSGGKYGTPPDQGLLRAFDTTNGAVLLDYIGTARRFISVALSDAGNVLAATADDNQLYLFPQKGGAFPAIPTTPFAAGKHEKFVAVHPSGAWLAACDKDGNIYQANLDGGAVSSTSQWHTPITVGLLAVAIAADADVFVVGGDDVVYLFNRNSVANGPVAQYQTGAGVNGVRWVAISDDGLLITTVVNQFTGGLLIAISVNGAALAFDWHRALQNNPNSTRMDSAGTYVTVAGGYPDNVPGAFYLFDSSGNPLWAYPTSKMNWPMVISANAQGIAAGSDDNTLYFFVP
jgi:WD40 repeat protein